MSDEMTEKGEADAETIRRVLDEFSSSMPIFATRIGYRTNSSVADRRLGEWLLDTSREWREMRERGEL